MSDYETRSIQKPEESLHWISFNLKMIAKELKLMTPSLQRLADLTDIVKKATEKKSHHDEVPF